MLIRASSKTSSEVGQITEALAAEFLATKGLTKLDANVRFRFGEIDLVMCQGQTLVFVEVRYRQNSNFGGALESITEAKLKRLRCAGLAYLQKHPELADYNCRFDLIAMQGSIHKPSIDWLINIDQ